MIAEGLVLTAAHVIDDDGKQPPSVKVVASDGAQLTAMTVWSGATLGVDAALVATGTSNAGAEGERHKPTPWGRLTGSAPEVRADTSGFPEVLRDGDGEHVVEHLSGTLNPGVANGDRYDLLLENRPAMQAGDLSPWRGLSGAALFCGRLLVGVIVIDVEVFRAGRLTAVPVWRLLENPDFAASVRDYGCSMTAESVELHDLFVPPPRVELSRSPARLLGADVQVVPFRGRDEILADLTEWSVSEAKFSTLLITGSGGQGKTRLALELCRVLSTDNWITGLVSADVARAKAAIGQIPDTQANMLLVVDYAETRTAQLRDLISTAWLETGEYRVRVLLLARSAGQWWNRLQGRLSDALDDAVEVTLLPLESDRQRRYSLFAEAQKAFLAQLVQKGGDTDWQAVAERASVSDLGDKRFASVLTLHMTALNSILQAAHGDQSEDDPGVAEKLLLRHEERYWEVSLVESKLEGVCDWSTLTRCVTAATLCGATTPQHAVELLGQTSWLGADWSVSERRNMAQWLHELFPESPERYWGPLQPDLLGEYLINKVDEEDEGFIDELLKGIREDRAHLAMSVAARIGDRLEHEDSLACALPWYERAARLGHADAAHHIGYVLHAEGDVGGAQYWLRIAAERNHLDAAFSLAELLASEQHDGPAADHWYQQAAERGHLDAAYRLGRRKRGGGHLEDAARFLGLASDGGHHDAAVALAEIELQDGRRDLVRPRLEHAASCNNANAAYQLGWLAERDNDWQATEQWWHRAASQGHRDAAYALAESYWTKKQPELAEPLYRQASRDGHWEAATQLGWLLMEVEGNRLAAREAWWEGAQHGSLQAAELLSEHFPDSQ